jgi:hypothetical protein
MMHSHSPNQTRVVLQLRATNRGLHWARMWLISGSLKRVQGDPPASFYSGGGNGHQSDR